VNFAACVLRIVRTWNIQVVANLFLALLITICLAGCGDQVRLPSAEQLAEFESAGPIRPTVDLDRLVRARRDGGLYRVVLGDVLELTMPTILQVVTAERLELPERVSPFTPYLCRVGESGSITLPIVGQIEVAGKSLAEIESAIIDAYHPKYIGDRPSVLARVAEYKMATISISGAVTKPGVYELRSDRMSLVALLMEADGIVDEGAALIHIIRPKTTGNEERPCQSGPSAAFNKAPRTENHIGTTVRASEEPPKLDARKGILLGPRSVSSRQIKVQLTLHQLNSKSTKGVLLVDYDGKVLRVKNVDIRSELHRHTLVRYLVEKDQRFSTVNLESELIVLAEELQTIVSLECELAALTEELRAIPAPENARTNSGKPDGVGKAGKDEIEPEQNFISDKATYKQLVESLDSQSNRGHQDTLKRRTSKPEPLVLPVKGLNIPFADVALQDGDTVVVERLELPLVTVIGLVDKQGNFPYPPDTQYNLMQALGFAGGLDQAAEPRYATVYRLKPDGEVVHATFAFRDKSGLTAASNVLIKPGDIVDVEHTPRTRRKAFLDKVFRINLGVYAPLQLFGTNR